MHGIKKKIGLMLGAILAMASPLQADHDHHGRHNTYDYIIVGNGAAGAILARKLSDDHKTKVLVLETGENNTSDPNVLNADTTNLFGLFTAWTNITINPKYAANYPFNAFGAPLLTGDYSEGQGWGGSSSHHYLITVRGSPAIYDNWAALVGDSSWSYNSLLPMMIAFENYVTDGGAFDAAQRGSGGPISVTQTNTVAQIMMDPLGGLLATGMTAGLYMDDYNDPTIPNFPVGMTPAQLWATPGAVLGSALERTFSAKDYLPASVVTPKGKAVDGRLLRIESNATVSRVIFEGDQAVGVEFVYGLTANKVLKAYGKKIILCAGGINSPAILQRSGIGPQALLNSLGIETIVDNPNVGANLLNHYGTQAVVLGSTTANPFLQGFVNGNASTALSTYTIPFNAPFTYPNDSVRRLQIAAFQVAFMPFAISIVDMFILDPQSTGSVQIVSKSPLVKPNLDLGMYTDGPVSMNGTDANLAITGLYLLANSIGPANMLFPPSIYFASDPGTDAVQDAQLFASATQANGYVATSHIMATAKMGTSVADGVVDSNLNVFGVKNLMVADLSVTPVSIDGNTCYTAYLIAMNAARKLGVSTPPAL